MKILVTGAEGFIGSHLIERLIAKGHQVTAFVFIILFFGWLENIDKQNFKKIKVITGDVRDYQSISMRQKPRYCY